MSNPNNLLSVAVMITSTMSGASIPAKVPLCHKSNKQIISEVAASKTTLEAREQFGAQYFDSVIIGQSLFQDWTEIASAATASSPSNSLIGNIPAVYNAALSLPTINLPAIDLPLFDLPAIKLPSVLPSITIDSSLLDPENNIISFPNDWNIVVPADMLSWSSESLLGGISEAYNADLNLTAVNLSFSSSSITSISADQSSSDIGLVSPIIFVGQTYIESPLIDKSHPTFAALEGGIGQSALAKDKLHISQLLKIFADASSEEFEDGVPSQFTEDFLAYMRANGKSAVASFAKITREVLASEPALGTALRYLGDIVDKDTFEQRRQLLEEQLFSNSIYRKDGALSGIVSLRDKKSIIALQTAYKSETEAIARKLIARAIQLVES